MHTEISKKMSQSLGNLAQTSRFLTCLTDRLVFYVGDIAIAAILHLASSVPQKLQFSATDFNSYNTVKSGRFVNPQTDGVRTENGQKMTVPRSVPGLGVEPNWDSLKLQFTIE